MIIYLTAISVFLMIVVIIPRFTMLHRANALLREMPDHTSTALYLKFSSISPKGKRQEMDEKIDEMAQDGWVFLKANEANPLKTLRSWGGGINLHFIRS